MPSRGAPLRVPACPHATLCTAAVPCGVAARKREARSVGTSLPWRWPLCSRGPSPLPVSALQAQAQLQESSQKLDLLRLALGQLLEGLPSAHPLRGRVARELRTAVSGNPQPSGVLVKPTALTGSQESLPHQGSPFLPTSTLKHRGGELGRRVSVLVPPPPSFPLSGRLVYPSVNGDDNSTYFMELL